MENLMNNIKNITDPKLNGDFEKKFEELQQPRVLELSEKERVLKIIQDIEMPILPALKDTKLFLNAIEVGNQFKVWKAGALKQINDL